MRKITSQQDTEKKNKRKQLLVGGILIFIMLISTLGYSFSRFAGGGSNSEQMNYRGYTFAKQNGLWNTQLNGLAFSFSSNPNEIINENSNVSLTLNNYQGQPLYVSSENPDAEYEIYRNLDSLILRRQSACLEGEKCSNKDFPVKTCDDNFIIIREANNTKISQKKNCVFIEGEREKLVNITDGFLFKIIGI